MHDLGLVGCVGVWGGWVWGWGVVLGLGGLVLGLRVGAVGIGHDGFWDIIFGVLGGTGWVRVLVDCFFWPGELCWGMGGWDLGL